MAGYSRENKRQNEALESILRGELPEKRIFIANEDLEFKKQLKKEKEEEKKRIDEKFEATKEARVPWFCPECDKVMKKRLDDRMWYLYSHCFDCQVKIEHKMRLDNTYDEWEQDKIKANKKSYIDEMEQMVVEWRKLTEENPQFHNQVASDGYTIDSEDWKQTEQNKEFLNNLADNALEYLKNMKEKL